MQDVEPRGAQLEIRLLGPVEARLSERRLELDRLQQRALLALLALNANRVVSTDQLIDALWGERPPATASVALYGLVSGLRKLLEPDHAAAVVTKAPGYLLEVRSRSTSVVSSYLPRRVDARLVWVTPTRPRHG
jgi:DNA-binding SARP family transcriptional activator